MAATNIAHPRIGEPHSWQSPNYMYITGQLIAQTPSKLGSCVPPAMPVNIWNVGTKSAFRRSGRSKVAYDRDGLLSFRCADVSHDA